MAIEKADIFLRMTREADFENWCRYKVAEQSLLRSENIAQTRLAVLKTEVFPQGPKGKNGEALMSGGEELSIILVHCENLPIHKSLVF